MRRLGICLFAVATIALTPTPGRADSTCDPDGVQDSGSKYRICMPAASDYNNRLVIWAHGFQDAGTPVQIPEDQLCFSDVCLPDLVNSLGFAFATNSYSKTGLAVLEGQADILDLVQIFASKKGMPERIYLVGASEGGLITALSVEQYPQVFAAGVAACGPIGDFRRQIDYFGDGRATFNYFFPGVIPGDPFEPDPETVAGWLQHYEDVVKPIVFDPAKRHQLDQWVRVAKLPFDPANYLGSLEISVRDMLRYSVVNLNDAAETLGGFPFDNKRRWYTGSDSDFFLNLFVPRKSADPAALTEMETFYRTTGALVRPLVTMHTLKDQQIPYWHEQFYALKTLASGTFLTRHFNIPIDRFEHCNFTSDEALFSFVVMLFYDGVLVDVSGVSSMLRGPALAAFEQRALAMRLPYRRGGDVLSVRIRR